MQFGEQGRRARPDRERAKHLACVLRSGRDADLTADDVALPDDGAGRPLCGHAHDRRIRGGDAQVVDLVLAAEADVCVLGLSEHLMISRARA
jgi:hypothetical protein